MKYHPMAGVLLLLLIFCTSATGQTVNRWKKGDAKINLKIRESHGQYKMAFYYVPPAAEVNLEQLEDLPAEVYDRNPHK